MNDMNGLKMFNLIQEELRKAFFGKKPKIVHEDVEEIYVNLQPRTKKEFQEDHVEAERYE